MNQDGYCYSFSIQFRTVLGGFSVLTDPAPLARLEIVFQYSVFNLSRRFRFRQYDYKVHHAEKARILFLT